MNFKYNYYKPYEAGIFLMGQNGSEEGKGYAFAFDAFNLLSDIENCGLVIFDNEGNSEKIPFTSVKRGSVYGIAVEELDPLKHSYCYYHKDELIIDSYAYSYKKNYKFGEFREDFKIVCGLPLGDYDWENDVNPNIPYEKSILYGLNVRAFTMNSSSKVKAKGCYEGIIEKINYFKELGITAIVMMPTYEFDECCSFKNIKRPKNVDELNEAIKPVEPKVNCWGFDSSFYFAPKADFSVDDNPIISFKKLIKALHKNGIEAIMQIYFPEGLSQSLILRILKFWTYEYHIDGFRISGFNIPKKMIIDEPTLRDSKLWFDYVDDYDIKDVSLNYIKKYVASNNGNFRYDLRRFNKGDEGVINDILNCFRRNPDKNAVINYICDYDGFSLNDLYSYERKHNISNGENNADGNDANFSWNCGIEGPSRKKSIKLLRLSQIKNALIMLFLSAGTPYIFSGDEFGNSRYGNNNAYCQDNEVFHVEWKNNSMSNEILGLVKYLIRLRKDNDIFSYKSELTNMDVHKCGYPDLSYHGFEAWRPDLGYNSRTIGILYYGPSLNKEYKKSFYVGINMHWENRRIAMPKLNKGLEIKKIIDTSNGSGNSKENEIPLLSRSISVYEIY